ncbi:MAG: FAD-dependent oxidoreductase [Silicimonas sp.]|jgi:3-phenylpropionate/trans-cinnamate dioxygenase ferredoxin reductase subunit|nr:FAD-dependent oxidoreductase [Silicimonas sp.]
MTEYVIIGGGQAAASLAEKLRAQGAEGPVIVIGDEPYPPYERPPLSKAYLLGEQTRERLFLRPEAIYAEKAITLKLGTPVSAVDPEAKTVTAGGERVSYDHLAFTTGSVPIRLPASVGGDLAGVFTVRSLADIDAMAPRFTEGARVLVVGGGYIGLEAAAVSAKLGLRVTLVEMSERILGRVAAPETADVIRDAHIAHGVDLREGVGLAQLTGEGSVAGAVLTDGTEIAVDFVIVGIGIRPDTRLAEAAGIACDNGIAVDEYGRTSQESIWAAGDCASFPYKGKRIRLESVQNAIDQSATVAANMLGAGATYRPYPWFWSDQYDLKLQIAGLNTGYDRVVRRGAAPTVSHWYFRGDDLLAVDAINAPRDYMVGKRLLEAGKSVTPEEVSDGETDLKALLQR